MKSLSGLLALLLLILGLAATGDEYTTPPDSAPGASKDLSASQNYVLNTLENRRTVRSFKPTPVPDDHLTLILNAARYAPTAGNQQPWKFLVVRDRKKLDRLKGAALLWYLERLKQSRQPDEAGLVKARKAVQATLENVLSAPVYVAVLVDSTCQYPRYIVHDGTLAAGYLMIAARALGYGTGFFTTFFPGAKMKPFFGIPDEYKLICFTPIGVPHEWPETPPKKPLEELVVYESFEG